MYFEKVLAGRRFTAARNLENANSGDPLYRDL